NQELARLATNKGVKVPPGQAAPAPLMGKYRDINDRLAALSGEEFDREYMRNQVRMRDESIAIFERQVKKGKDTELRSFAIQALPALRERQRATQDLADKIGAMKKPVNKAPDNTSQPSNTSAPSTPPNK